MKNLNSMLGKIVSNTISDEIKMISITELHDSPDNFFKISNIEELAESIIAQGGVKENLIVRSLETGGYEIISGHRRKTAVQYLLDNGYDIGSKLPCLVQSYADENEKTMDLIMMNISQRVISDAEMIECYNKLHKVFEDKKALGEKFGRLRNKIAETLNVSTGKVSMIENIQKNAEPEIIDAVKSGKMSIATANEVAKLDKDEQKKIVENPEKAYTEAKKKSNEKKSAKLGTKVSEEPIAEKEEFFFDEADEVMNDKSETNNKPDDLSIKAQTVKILEGYIAKVKGEDDEQKIISCIKDARSDLNKAMTEYLTSSGK